MNKITKKSEICWIS